MTRTRAGIRPAGVIAPVPTPFTGAGDPDLATLARHLTWLEGEGLDGVLVLGSNGEFPSLTLTERLDVAVTAAEAAGSMTTILNVGSCALAEAAEAAGRAAELGYDAVLAPPPFYFRSAPVEGLAAFVVSLLDHSPLPVLLYHIPTTTGVPVSDALLSAVLDHPRFAGVKDSSGSPDELLRFAGQLESRALFVGNDRLVRTCRDAGGAGSITACASVAPRLVSSALVDDRGLDRLVALRTCLERHGLIPSVKAVLSAWGLSGPMPRPPLTPLGTAAAAALVAEVESVLGRAPGA